jgi:hypothetical protein
MQRTRSLEITDGAKMGEVIRFVPRAERERARLIRRARAIYNSVFPPADPVSADRDKASLGHEVSNTDTSQVEAGRVP